MQDLLKELREFKKKLQEQIDYFTKIEELITDETLDQEEKEIRLIPLMAEGIKFFKTR